MQDMRPPKRRCTYKNRKAPKVNVACSITSPIVKPDGNMPGPSTVASIEPGSKTPDFNDFVSSILVTNTDQGHQSASNANVPDANAPEPALQRIAENEEATAQMTNENDGGFNVLEENSGKSGPSDESTLQERNEEVYIKLGSISIFKKECPLYISNERTFLMAMNSYFASIGKDDPEIHRNRNLTISEKFTNNVLKVLNTYNLSPACRFELEYDVTNFDPETRNVTNITNAADSKMNKLLQDYVRKASSESVIALLTECVLDFRKLPSFHALQSVFDYILNLPNEEYIRNKNSLQSVCEVFDVIFREYPPNSSAMSNYYKMLVMRPLPTTDKSLDKGIMANRKLGIFYFVIKSLRDELLVGGYRPEGPITKNNVPEKENDDTIGSRKFETFNQEARIRRLFISLEIIVKLLQADLVLFMHIYKGKYSKKLYTVKQPIICDLVWCKAATDNDGGKVNTPIKEIIKIFVKVIRLDICREYEAILSKLLTVIVHGVTLYEPNPNKLYPYVTFLSKNLFTEIGNTLKVERPDVVLQALPLLKPAHMQFFVTANIIKEITSKQLNGIGAIYELVKSTHNFAKFDKYNNILNPGGRGISSILKMATMKYIYNLIYHATMAYVEGQKIHEFDRRLIEDIINRYEENRSNEDNLEEMDEQEDSTNEIDATAEEVEALKRRKKLIARERKISLRLSSEHITMYYIRCRLLSSFAKYCRTTLQEMTSST